MNYGLWIIYLSLKLIIYHIFIQFLDKGNIIIWNDKNDKRKEINKSNMREKERKVKKKK